MNYLKSLRMNSKFLIAPIFLFLFCSSTFAQTQKGNFVISGKTNLNFLLSNITTGTDSIQTGKSSSSQFDFTAGAAYFIANNLSVGVAGTYSYNYSKIESGYATQNITQSYTVLPQVQYYFPIEGKLKPSILIGGGYVWLQERDSRVSENYNKVYSLSGPSFAGGVGFSYFIIPSVSFDLGLQYSYAKLNNHLWENQFQKQNQFSCNMGISLFL